MNTVRRVRIGFMVSVGFGHCLSKIAGTPDVCAGKNCRNANTQLCHRQPLFLPHSRHHVDAARDERGPAGLMRGAEATAGVALKVLVELNEVAPVRIVHETWIVAVTWAPATRTFQA